MRITPTKSQRYKSQTLPPDNFLGVIGICLLSAAATCVFAPTLTGGSLFIVTDAIPPA